MPARPTICPAAGPHRRSVMSRRPAETAPLVLATGWLEQRHALDPPRGFFRVKYR